MKLFVCILIALPITLLSATEPIKIATWNIENLRAVPGQGPNPRYGRDYLRLRDFASLLNADILALQEVENEEALTRLFDPKLYQFFVSNRERGNKQRTAFVVRRTLTVKRFPDLRELNTTSGLRHGVDIEVTTGQHSIRFLVVHLKSFCFDDPLPIPDAKGDDCEKLASQVPVLEKWIDERVVMQTPFIVLGDFNRRFDNRGDAFWLEIDDGEPEELTLFRATSERKSYCWDGETGGAFS